MAVLEQFFRITMMLALILIGMNLALEVFLESMTGIEHETFLTSRGLAGGDLTSETQVSIAADTNTATTLEQTGSSIVTPLIDTSNFVKIQESILDIGGGYNALLNKIFYDVGGGSEDVLAVGRLIRSIILAIQLIGLAYIPFALVSAFTGGGAP